MTMSRKEKALQFADEGYNIQITGRHVKITDAMKNYALEKSRIEDDKISYDFTFFTNDRVYCPSIFA